MLQSRCLFHVLFLIGATLALTQGSAVALGLSCDDEVALVPPPVGDATYARWLMESATRQIRAREDLSCDPFIDYEESAAVFDRVGITAAFPRAPTDLGEKQVVHLSDELGATHWLALRGDPAGGSVEADLYEVRNQRRIARVGAYALTFDKATSKSKRSHPLPRYLAAVAANAVTLGSGRTSVLFSSNQGSRTLYRSPYVRSQNIYRTNISLGWYIADAEGLFLKTWDSIFGGFL